MSYSPIVSASQLAKLVYFITVTSRRSMNVNQSTGRADVFQRGWECPSRNGGWSPMKELRDRPLSHEIRSLTCTLQASSTRVRHSIFIRNTAPVSLSTLGSLLMDTGRMVGVSGHVHCVYIGCAFCVYLLVCVCPPLFAPS
jgi:hypothetical protein